MAPQQVSPSKAELTGFLFGAKKYCYFLMTNKGDFQSIMHNLCMSTPLFASLTQWNANLVIP